MDKAREHRAATLFYERQKERVEGQAASSRAQLLALLVPEREGWAVVELQQPAVLYKVVASVKGELLSTFDGTTRYRLGKWTQSKLGACSWPPLTACFYGYQLVEQALGARFPKGSKHLDAPKVLMKVEGSGKAYFHPATGMWAVGSVRPLSLLPGSGLEQPSSGSAEKPAGRRSREESRAEAEERQRRSCWVPC